MTEQTIVELVRGAIADAGSMRQLATKWGVTVGYLADVCNGRRAPGPGILEPLGIERVRTVQYRRKKTAKR